MMDVSAKDLRVSIAYDDGSSPLDVSDLVAEFTPRNSQLGEHLGLIKTTGSLKLHAFPVAAIAESTNPKRNPRRWARGNRIIIQVANSTGVLVPHPRGFLHILKPPSVPRPGRTVLEIQIGCTLSLQDWRQPPGDASGIELGTLTQRDVIINRLAQVAGVPSLVDPIAEYPIDYPIPRLNGGWVEQMGLLAHDAGYVLYIDPIGQLRAQQISLLPSDPDFVLTVGADDMAYDNLEPDESPCEIIRAVGVRPEIKDTTDPEPELAIANDAEYSPSEISETRFEGMATASPVITRTSKQPRGRVMPDSYPNSPTLITATEERTVSYYSEGDDGVLLRKYVRNRQPAGVVFPSTNAGEQGLTVASETYIDYFYADDVTVQIVTKVYEPAELVYPDLDVDGKALASLTIERWSKTNSGWVKSTTTRNFKPGGTASSSTNYSGSGNNQPSAPERRQLEKYGEDKQLTGECHLPPQWGSSYYEREREFQVATPVSQAHVDWLAQLQGALLWGLQQRCNWGIDVRDRFLTHYRPLMVMDWIETDPVDGVQVRSRYLTNGIAFGHVKDKAAVAGDGLYLGQISVTTPGLSSPPYTVRNLVHGGLRLGGSSQVYDYVLTLPTAEAVGGLRIGGSSLVYSSTVVSGGLRLGGSSESFDITLTRGGLRLGGSSTEVRTEVRGGLRIGGRATDVTPSTLPTSLLAYWKMEESSGARLDSTTNAYDLTPFGSTSRETGKLGFATGLGGGYLQSTSTAFDLGNSSSWTIAAWVYMGDKDFERWIISKDSAGGRGWDISYISNNVAFPADWRDRINFQVLSLSNSWLFLPCAGFSPPLNTWFLIVAWHDATAQTVNIQCNNGSVSSLATGGALNLSTVPPFRIAPSEFGISGLAGRADEVGIWTRALTAEERAELWNSGSGKTYPFT